MIRTRERLITAILCATLFALCGFAGAADESVKIRFGTLPVLQALPLYVAHDKGLFRDKGLDVELIPFNSAANKDIALSTGNVDGVFADLVTPTVLRGNGRDTVIVATTYDTKKDRRMFAVLGKPGGPYKNLKDLAGVPVAVSSNSVIHYVTETLLKGAGVPADKIETVEVKNIGLRFQMLLTGRVEAATLPEPLVTAALAKGAVLLGDDADLSTSQTVLVFNGSFVRDHSDAVRKFLAAAGEAAELVNTEPDAIRPLMVEHVRLPPLLKATYPTPRFPAPHPPDESSVNRIVDWLAGRGVIPRRIDYRDLVHVGRTPPTADSAERGR